MHKGALTILLAATCGQSWIFVSIRERALTWVRPSDSRTDTGAASERSLTIPTRADCYCCSLRPRGIALSMYCVPRMPLLLAARIVESRPSPRKNGKVHEGTSN